MKKIFVPAVIALVACFMLFNSPVNSQRKSAENSNGFWVVVTNTHVKKEATIQFYNNEKQLIYEEKITGKKLKLGKRKTIQCLEKGLDKALTVYNTDRTILKNKDWMAMLLASR